MSSTNLIETSSPVEGVKVITFNRPKKRNALSKELIGEFLSELAKASRDSEVRVIVITGSGTFFSAGADLNDIAALDEAAARSCRYLEDLCSGMASVRKPLVAAVNGPALGGGFEVALMCDLILASKRAYFALPEVQRGLIPGAGGTQRLTAAVGKFTAMRIILLGHSLTAEEAVSSGVVCDALDDSELMKRTMDIAQSLADKPPIASQLAKEAICRADQLCRDDDFERCLYYSSFGTAEKRRGVDDFLRHKATLNGSTVEQIK